TSTDLGLVTDSTSAVAPGAKVAITRVATGETRASPSSSNTAEGLVTLVDRFNRASAYFLDDWKVTPRTRTTFHKSRSLPGPMSTRPESVSKRRACRSVACFRQA